MKGQMWVVTVGGLRRRSCYGQNSTQVFIHLVFLPGLDNKGSVIPDNKGPDWSNNTDTQKDEERTGRIIMPDVIVH